MDHSHLFILSRPGRLLKAVRENSEVCALLDNSPITKICDRGYVRHGQWRQAGLDKAGHCFRFSAF
jgi:hypothetical protein